MADDSGFDAWIEEVKAVLVDNRQRVEIRRDHFAYLIGLFWDGKTPAQAYDWLKSEHVLVARS